MDESIRITQGQLQSALAQWEQNHRGGRTRTYEETLALPVEQVAQESAAYLFGVLRRTSRPKQPA